MIRDAAARRSTITNANLLVELCRGKVSALWTFHTLDYLYDSCRVL